MALTGDTCITRRISIYSEQSFLTLRNKITSADVAFTNLETLFHDYEGPAMHESHGTYMRSDPSLVSDLRWLGFNLISLANNHAGDYGVAGMRANIRHLRNAGMKYAGVGESLPEAREAAFRDTPAGRVALISVASTFPAHARAGNNRGRILARPGLNPLRHSTHLIVSRRWMNRLEAMLEELNVLSTKGAEQLWVPPGAIFEVGDSPGLVTRINETDLNEISLAVNNASRFSDYTIVSIHAHESGVNRQAFPLFLQSFAHTMIDAGASVVVGHGPHVLRGIEIYKERPIFYSLGSFIYQSDTITQIPSEMYEAVGSTQLDSADINEIREATNEFINKPESWESVLVFLRWRLGGLLEIQLYPVSLNAGASYSARGRPVLCEPEQAEKILSNLESMSKPLGTTLQLQENVGIIRIADG